MAEGLSTDLVVLAFCTWICCALVAARDLPLSLSLVLAGIRVAVPLTYFAWYFDSSRTIIDDLTYVANARQLADHGYGPLSVLFDPSGWDLLHALSHGHHVFYAWWNLLGMSIFGEHYYTAVFLNVLVTFVGANLLGRLLRLLDFPADYCQGFQIFWLLHWDLIAWSSLWNIKDSIVQTLSIASFFCLVQFFQNRQVRYLLGFVCISALFWWIRFYVPVLMLTAVTLWMATQWNDARKYILVPLGGLALYLAQPLLADVAELVDPEPILFGLLRFSLTPTPWSIDESYSYLWLPAVLHWLFFLPMALGVGYLWRSSKTARLFLIYLGCLLCLYAITDELLGPRQRFQVAFLLAWGQFQFLWMMRSFWAARNQFADFQFRPLATRA